MLVTGGAGFIGSHYVDRRLRQGDQVTVYDSLVRPGADANLEWLRARHPGPALRFVHADVRDAERVAACCRDVDLVLHLAAQVAVTSSVADPRLDFEVNALGTLNVLEGARRAPAPPVVLYASTNKVYGAMTDLAVVEEPTRYRLADRPHGVDEGQPLDLHSPYGCSKGSGDQYARDYHRIFGLQTVVFRQSCIYGPRQCGCEDQGWVAHLAIAARSGQPITVFGDGKQVRDLLHVDDLCRCYDAAVARIATAAGRIYNVGGGPERTLAVWRELGPWLERALGRTIPVAWGPWRPGDQRVFVADVRRAWCELGWAPHTAVDAGLAELLDNPPPAS